MNLQSAKALFFAQYLGQAVSHMHRYQPYTLVIKVPHAHFDETELSLHEATVFSDTTHLLLRSIDQLTDEEKQIITERMQIYPEDVIDWINGYCGHGDFENLYTWLPCYDILKSFGILLPFTYLNEEQKPITLQPDEVVSFGWAKIKTL